MRLKMALKSMGLSTECFEACAVEHSITCLQPPEFTWKDLSHSVTLVLNVGDAIKIPPDDLRLYAPCDFKGTGF